MTKSRMKAFSDGVTAIIITIMVLELKVPHETSPEALKPLLPVLLSYVLSFVYVGIYWNNHHHLLHSASRVSGGILWANLHLLFWLSLFPFVTGWMGENHFTLVPTVAYGAVLLCAAVAYSILQWRILVCHGNDSVLAKAIGKDFKGKVSRCSTPAQSRWRSHGPGSRTLSTCWSPSCGSCLTAGSSPRCGRTSEPADQRQCPPPW